MMFIKETILQKDRFESFDLFKWALILVIILMTFFFEFLQMCITGYHVGNVGGALFFKTLCIYLSPLVFHSAHSIYYHAWAQLHIKIAAITVFIQVLFSSYLPAFLLFLVYPVKVISLIIYIQTLFIYILLVGFILIYFVHEFIKQHREHHNNEISPKTYFVLVLNLCMNSFYFVYFALFLFLLLFLLVLTNVSVIPSSFFGIF